MATVTAKQCACAVSQGAASQTQCSSETMGRSLEILHGDLRVIHAALGEVLSCTHPDVPSWRFPEKLSTSVTLEDVLGCRESESEDSNGGKVLLLEGIIDRLILLLQSSLKLWNETEDCSSRPLPLSLSSVVKKYCRRLLQQVKTRQDLQQQLTAKDVLVSSLNTSMSKAQEECQLLQDALTNNATSQTRPRSVLPRDVPYEARSSLKINRLQTERRSYNDIHEQSQSLEISASDNCLVTVPQSRLMTPAQPPPSHATVSTQTAETAFALCVRCYSTLFELTTAAGGLQELCNSLQVMSHMAEKNWEREAGLGVLEPREWGEVMSKDLKAIKTHSLAQEKELKCLRDLLAQQKSHEEKLQSDLSCLSLQYEQLQQTVTDSKRSHTKELALYREAASGQLSEMEAACQRTEQQRERLAQQLSQVQREKEELIASSADIGRHQNSLQAELLVVRERETALRGSQAALESQLEKLHIELVECKQQLETEQLELSKTTVLNNTLQRKHRAVLSHQQEVLQRLEEMDKETEELRRELAESTSARTQLASRVEELQTECTSLQSHVADQELKAAASAKEEQTLCEKLTSLEIQLSSLSSELEEEREKCRLLVDYPENTTQLSAGRETQKHISANTIRILLLEEKNSELRESIVQQARQINGKRTPELTKPTPLWQSSVISQAGETLLNRAPAPEHSSTTHKLPAAPLVAPHHRASPTSSSSSLPYNSVIHTCASCDRMFPDRRELYQHQLSAHSSH